MKQGIWVMIWLSIWFVALGLQQCNNTHLDFFSEYSLGKQDQLNRTFTKMQKNLSAIPDVEYQYSDFSKYKIFNIKPKLFYRDSQQRAQIYQETILIVGGVLEIDFTFDWNLTSFSAIKTGSAVGFALTNQTTFGKKVVTQKGFYVYTLVDVYNITSNITAKLTRIDPVDKTTADDIKALGQMLNDLKGQGLSVRDLLLQQVNKNYKTLLNESLHDESYQPIQNYAYVWEDPIKQKGKLVVNFTNRPTGVNINTQGIVMTYNTVLTDFPAWECGNYSVPSMPEDKKVYGGIQQFVSHTIFENTIRLARDKGFFDTKLTRLGWQSRFFQFYAGDLYQVIPKVAETFPSNTQVEGQCLAQKKDYNYKPAGSYIINITMSYSCKITVNLTQVAQFSLTLETSVEGKANTTHLNFDVVSVYPSNFQYVQVGGYKVQNKQLAETIISHCLRRMLNQRVFGSGYRLYTRDYPHFTVFDKYVLIFDSSHLGNSLSYS